MTSIKPHALPRWRAAPRPLRYLVVGAACAALNNVLLIVAVFAGFHYLVALCLVCPPMLVIGYTLHVKMTFDVVPSASSFLRYGLAILANYPMWIVSLFVLEDVAHVAIYIAAPIATGVVFGLNYLSTHWAIQRSLQAAFRFRVDPTCRS